MAPRSLLLFLVVLCGVQVHAGLLNFNGNGILSQYKTKIQSWQQDYQKLINNGKATRNELQAAIEKVRNDIKQQVAVAGEKASVAEECWKEQHDQIEEIEHKFEDDSQKCVDDNIGPAVQAAEKLERDLDSYANRTQELLEEGQKCGWNIRCQQNVASQLVKLQQDMGPLLLEDYFDLEQKSIVAADAIRRCEKEVLAEESAALQQVYDAVQKCIQDHETASASPQEPQTTA